MELEIYAYRTYSAVVRYTGSDTHVTIPAIYKGVPVTEVKERAFAENSYVKSVLIPDTIQTIGDSAFEGCKHLLYVGYRKDDGTLPGSQYLPGGKLVDLCDSVSDRRMVSMLPKKLNSIGARAFAGTGLRRLEIQATSPLEIGDSAFEGCPDLQVVAFPSCKTIHMGKRAFMGSSIGVFHAPNMIIDVLPEETFAECAKLQSVSARINSVGPRSFRNCKMLLAVNMPPRLRSVGAGAFEGCENLDYAKKYIKPPKPPKLPEPILDTFPDLDDTGPITVPNLSHIEEAVAADLAEISKMLDNWRKADEDKALEAAPTDNLPLISAKPIFQLQVSRLSGFSGSLPPRVKGYFATACGDFWFSIHSPSKYERVRLNCKAEAEMNGTMPLIRFLAGSNRRVILTGVQSNDLYSVVDIQTDPTDKSEKGLSREFFSAAIKRIKKPVPTDINLETATAPFTMRNTGEFEALLEICADRFPGWVVQAYNRNREITKASGFGSDERKHAAQAMELLMNIDWLPEILNVPSAEAAKAELDASFYGLETVKRCIMEVIAQIRRTGTFPKWGILLHGAAGVGKTSIAKAIAKVLNLPYIQMDMSTLGDDPDAISGSSRIFSNARPGLLLESMFTLRSSTALLIANEVDKAAGKGRSASETLLTILDKTGFYENYLEEVMPTDNLFCIGTCNDLDKVSKPLLDRFHVIHIPGYTPAEKKLIWSGYAFPAAMERSHVSPDQLGLSDDAVDYLISKYTTEPGARDLEQCAERFVGDYCLLSDSQEADPPQKIYTVEDVKRLFGPSRVIDRNLAIHPGMARAALYHEGKVAFFHLEATVLPGSGRFTILGNMGDTQKEYCKVAYYCVRNTTSYDLSKSDVTVFCPAPLPDDHQNYVGLACYAAICSRILGKELALNSSCFIGGCTMNGSLYFDSNHISPILHAMTNSGVSVLYGPMGVNELVDTSEGEGYSTAIVEGPDAQFVFSLAVASPGLKC